MRACWDNTSDPPAVLSVAGWGSQQGWQDPVVWGEAAIGEGVLLEQPLDGRCLESRKSK